MTARLIVADCLDALRDLPDASVDAVVSDPPYDLTSGGKGGFMGKEWDGTGVAFDPETWRAVLRVLKPGGHLLAFGGTRTYHRLACAIEDAGFEIRDSIHWVYGCLTDDADILTAEGWKRGVDVAVGERVAQWDAGTQAITLAPVTDKFLAPWSGDLVRLHNADTDQLLTPNHRVYLRRKRHRRPNVRVWNDGYQVVEAGAIGGGVPIRLPLAGYHDGPGIGGTDYAALLGWVFTEGHFDGQGTGVRIYQSSVNQDHCDEIAALMDRIAQHKRYDRERIYRGRTYTESTWFFTGDLALRVRADLPGKHPTYDLLWQMTAAEKQAFFNAGVNGDGTRNGMAFNQKDADDLAWFQVLCATIGKRARITMRRAPRSGGAVYYANSATTELQNRHLRDRREAYTGEVWCVSVPTGAFVARRNGLIFITGNSGFPKSLDVSKAIDKAAGAERKVVGVRVYADGHVQNSTELKPPIGTFARTQDNRLETAPATDDAARWQGWGTALKPAHEPIVVARKPLAGTVAQTVLAHGTGAINVDGCRVGTEQTVTIRTGRADNATSFTEFGKPPGRYTNPPGRWPPNFVLTHAEGCEEVGQAVVKASGYYPAQRGEPVATDFGRGQPDPQGPRTSGNGDGTETVAVWNCVEGCPVREMDAQSGISKSPASRPRTPDGPPQATWSLGRTGGVQVGHNDTGGASRFFPAFRYQAKASRRERNAGLEGMPEKRDSDQVKADGPGGDNPRNRTNTPRQNHHPTVKPVELMRWLVRLVTPPGGVVLDPFTGSGTTGVAAVLEGFDFIGIEREPEYAEIAERRIAHAATTKDERDPALF